MSVTVIFTRTVLVNGSPANADAAPLLTDAGATFGVRRTDTGAVVVAAETVAGGIVQGPGTGLYSYTLTSATPGVTYEAAFKFFVAGQTSYSTKTVTAVGPRYGIYAGETDLDNQFGIANVTAWSDLDNANARNADRIQVALNRADQWVVQRFTAARVATPDNTSPYYPSLRYLAAQYAGTWLARARGANQAENGKATGVQDDNRDEAEGELQKIINGIRMLATSSVAPVVVPDPELLRPHRFINSPRVW